MVNFLSTKIALRTDTIQNWNSLSNQVLLNGEVAIVMTDENLPLFKIGDGVHKFYELPFSTKKISSDVINATDIIANSICQGIGSTAVPQGIAAGLNVHSNAIFSQAFGNSATGKDIYSFTWNGKPDQDIANPYQSHGTGSFSINPSNGAAGMYIGEKTLPEVISTYAPEFTKVSVDNEAVQDFKLLHIHYDDYAKLVADEKVDPHTMYVLSANGYRDQFGDRIANLGSPISADDAATKQYVDDEIARIPMPDLSEYYKKTETSSSIELANEFSKKASKQQLDGIEEKIPNAATSENQLADKAFVNSSINNYAAFYLTKNANGDAFGTYAELTSATKFWNAGAEKTPTKNDYLVVLEDETKTTALGVNPTTRYTYQGEWPTGQFEFQYIVNNTALTQAQVDAINSGITKSIVDSRVIPSTTNPGYALNADNATVASMAAIAENAENANKAKTALSADTALTANYALTADTALQASAADSALTANFAQTAEKAYSADYAPDYTPLSTFNQTLGDLASIIHEI